MLPLARLTLALLMLFATGCRLIQTVADVPAQTVRSVTPGQKEKDAADPVSVQRNLLRLADEFSVIVTFGIERLRRGTNEVTPAEIMRWKIAFVTETTGIASGPNPIANLLDLTAFVTMTRLTLEEHWQPESFGESAEALLVGCRRSETNLWQQTASVLTATQAMELRAAIEAWRRDHPVPANALATRAIGFASQVADAERTGPTKPDGFFSLLNVDPLAGLDPAMREIAQTRMFAERALYVSQKMPILLRWNTELLTLNALAIPTVQQFLGQSAQIATSIERLSAVGEQLPGRITREREEILKALDAQEKGLSALAGEVRQTLTAGAQMSDSLNLTLTTFDALMKRFGVGETPNPQPAKTNSVPFRILDYAQTADRLEGTARQLTELLRQLDHTLGPTNLAGLTAQVRPVVQEAQERSEAVINHIFWRAVGLVAVMLLAALIYRAFAGRRAAKHEGPR